MTAVLQSFEFPKKRSLRASSPIWASEASLPRTREREGLRTPFPSPRGFAARTRILTRLISLAQTGELAC